MKVISLPEIASRIRCRRSGKTLLSEFINQCKIEDAIIISKGATNGEVIKTMFPDELLTSITSTLWWGDNMSFNKDWWNAPYKGNLSEKSTGSESEDGE